MIKQNQKLINRTQVLLDILLILFSLVTSWYVRFYSGFFSVSPGGFLSLYEHVKYVWLLIPLFVILFFMTGLYEPHRRKTLFGEFINLFTALLMGTSIFVMVLYTIKEMNYSRIYLLIFFCMSVLLCTLTRFLLRLSLRKLRKKGFNLKHILLVGYSHLSLEFISAIDRNRWLGFDILGVVEAGNDVVQELPAKLTHLGNLDQLESIFDRYDVDEVIITLKLSEYDQLERVIAICEKAGVKTSIIPDYYRLIPSRPYIDEVDHLPIINIRYVALENLGNAFIKRLFDIVLSLIGLIVFSPFFVTLPLLIKMSSKGPILFQQERIGLNRKKFLMYKFRSMKVQSESESNTQWTSQNDPRKTAIGNFMRKTSLDEIPQLLNVLKGEMSLIGPRPEREFYVEQFKETIPKYMIKHQVRPGITGWAQVHGWRGDTSIEKRIEYDIHYIENWSLWLDIKIVFLTIFKGFVNKNAY